MGVKYYLEMLFDLMESLQGVCSDIGCCFSFTRIHWHKSILMCRVN